MPIYVFQCKLCGGVHEVLRSIECRNEPTPCPICSGKNVLSIMVRNFQAEICSTPNDFTHPVYSEALGVHPSQISEAKRRFPDHEFLPDGRMVIRSTAQRNRVFRDLGWDDRSSDASFVKKL